MINKDGDTYAEAGGVQLEGVNYTLIKLKHAQYVAGFLAHYIVVPSKSLPRVCSQTTSEEE